MMERGWEVPKKYFSDRRDWVAKRHGSGVSPPTGRSEEKIGQ